ncbi:MAG TPA: hypothetical protein VNO70_03940 [Blastocatellia bacterium]|nr:hypothetical protein [Blastocatellia bacterium]
MEAEQLWKELHYLFDTDDGSLPEIWIMNLSQAGVVAIFSYLQHNCHNLANNAVFWSIEDQQDKPIDSVPNAAALVIQGRAEPFHFLCQGLTYDGIVIPDMGVFVFDDQINLDYRMGDEWDAPKLKALFGILKELKGMDAGAKITIEDYALRTVRKHFETIWERFLQAESDF